MSDQHNCQAIENARMEKGALPEHHYHPSVVEISKVNEGWFLCLHEEFAVRITHCPFCGDKL